MNEPIHIISLGAGVQSSTMALMAAKGEITPMPVAAIFADTQAEPKSVYTWLDWLEKQLPFPVHRVTRGSLEANETIIRKSKKTGNYYMNATIPAYTKRPSGVGLLGRRCTSKFKIIPLQKKVKEICGIVRASKKTVGAVRMWIGISIDEAHRMKPSQVNYIENIWPLIDAGMTRKMCLAWMQKNNFPEPPRSACVFCPFHSDEEWHRLKTKEPADFLRAAKFESNLQFAATKQTAAEGTLFLHSSCIPLQEIDFAKNRPGYEQISLFGNECEGMCGV